jgi:hypothetical protein
VKFTLNEVQSKAVRELSEAVDNVLEANILILPDFVAAREEMKIKVEQLKVAFPELVKPATEYDADSTMDVPDWIADSGDHTEAAFDALVSTLMVDQAVTLSRYTRVLDTLLNELGDLASFSEDFDVNYGQWK